jgi:hypothetical protein
VSLFSYSAPYQKEQVLRLPCRISKSCASFSIHQQLKDISAHPEVAYHSAYRNGLRSMMHTNALDVL